MHMYNGNSYATMLIEMHVGRNLLYSIKYQPTTPPPPHPQIQTSRIFWKIFVPAQTLIKQFLGVITDLFTNYELAIIR